MLAERNIIAMSPELGTSSTQSNGFFLSKAMIWDVCDQHTRWIEYTLKELEKHPDPEVNIEEMAGEEAD